MKAFEVRNGSIQPQYESAMKDIEQAMDRGRSSTNVGYGIIYPEVAQMLAKDGFDIKNVKRKFMSYTEASWENAEEGREGTITNVDETQPKREHVSELTADILSSFFGLGKEETIESEEDEGATDE